MSLETVSLGVSFLAQDGSCSGKQVGGRKFSGYNYGSSSSHAKHRPNTVSTIRELLGQETEINKNVLKHRLGLVEKALQAHGHNCCQIHKSSARGGSVEREDNIKCSLTIPFSTTNNKSGKTQLEDVNKPRLPDIQMINKYYGLVPKKFTMHSRTPDMVYRYSKSARARTNIKSAASSSPLKRGCSFETPSASSSSSASSDTDSQKPKQLSQGQAATGTPQNQLKRQGQSPTHSSDNNTKGTGEKENNTSDASLLTRKLAVEKSSRNKVLRHRGRSRSSSLPVRLDDGQQQRAIRANMEENQRVVKIDLSTMRWEAGSVFSGSGSEELDELESRSSSSCSSMVDVNVNVNVNANDDMATQGKSDDWPCVATCTDAFGESFQTSVDEWNSDIDLELRTTSTSRGEMVTTSPMVDNEWRGGCNSINNNNDDNNVCVSTSIGKGTDAQRDVRKHAHTVDESAAEKASVNLRATNNGTGELYDDQGGKTNGTTFDVVNANNSSQLESVHVHSAEQMAHSLTEREESKEGKKFESGGEGRRAQLKKTISFDESMLTKDSSTGAGNKPKTQRPMTSIMRKASSISNIAVSTGTDVKQSSKVLPWTQKAGKNMTLAERRAKLQKTVSIHSSEFEIDECSESEFEPTQVQQQGKRGFTPPVIMPSPNSSAYKETTRKPLYFIPAPEIPTMVSQISPIQTLDIQCEIEKVAVILTNMQNQNKSFIDLTPDGANISRTQRSPKSPNENPKNSYDLNGNATISPKPDIVNQLDVKPNTSPNSVANGTSNEIGKNTVCKKEVPLPILPSNICLNENEKESVLPKEPVALKPQNGNISSPISNKNPDQEKIIFNEKSNSKDLQNPNPSKAKGAPRPILKKATSISCEKELTSKLLENHFASNLTSGDKAERRYLVNSSDQQSKGNKTQAGNLIRSSSTNSLPPSSTSRLHKSNVSNKQQPVPVTAQAIQSDKINAKLDSGPQNIEALGKGPKQMSAARNRKVLIKQALLEINQSRANLSAKKWGVFGRPKTAPNTNNPGSVSNVNGGRKAVNWSQQRRQQPLPLKASPPRTFPVKSELPSHNSKGKMEVRVSSDQGNGKEREDDNNGNLHSSDNQPEENLVMERNRVLHRQSFSLDEEMLLTFSTKKCDSVELDLHSNRSESNFQDKSSFMKREESNFLSSKKKEECLKIYEKMKATGMQVKLETIFRGMLTPTEFRTFKKAIETAAAKEAAESEDADCEVEGLEIGYSHGAGADDKIELTTNISSPSESQT